MFSSNSAYTGRHAADVLKTMIVFVLYVRFELLIVRLQDDVVVCNNPRRYLEVVLPSPILSTYVHCCVPHCAFAFVSDRSSAFRRGVLLQKPVLAIARTITDF